jgi:hypothetical protein
MRIGEDIVFKIILATAYIRGPGILTVLVVVCPYNRDYQSLSMVVELMRQQLP